MNSQGMGCKTTVQRKRFSSVLLLIVPLVALTACVSWGGVASPAPTLDPSLVDRSILTGQPCAAPCWYGLEPGRSTKVEVLAAIQALPFVDAQGTELAPYEYRDRSRQIDVTGTLLRLRCRQPAGAPCAGLILVDDALKQILVTPHLALTFGDLVAHLGPPEFVAAEPVVESAGICGVSLIWKQRRINAGFFGNVPRQQVRCADVFSGKAITPDLPVESVSYVSADDFALTNVPERGRDFPWAGFAKP